ncbi:MAG: hypothetical protein HY925_16615 [Elusimicrobia bacterium]|nr:hypothetical protein [Elusimicrobiota bacterium]
MTRRPWKGRAVLITAGPTREHLDPIRFMTNGSTGTMGFALARAASDRGAAVTVVSGPCCAAKDAAGDVVPVVSALDMHRAVLRRWKRADVVIGDAAVGDWRFVNASSQKIKRSKSGLTLKLVPNPDIIADVARRARADRRRRVLVGFALETDAWLENARLKLERKGLDLVVANRPASMGRGKSRAALVGRGWARTLPAMDKRRLANEILDAVEAKL